ncbi:MAG: VanW family protein [Patescibacteria group bacterium]|nr:VanW family protein [Patescibacteria group bacterium]
MFRVPLKKAFVYLEPAGLAVFFSLSLVFFLFHVIFESRIIPGVRILGVGSAAGLTFKEAENRTVQAYSEYETSPMTLDFGVREVVLSPNDLGVSLEATASVQRAFEVSRSGSLLSDLLTEVRTFFFGQTIEPAYVLNDSVWASKVGDIWQSFAGHPARFVYANGLAVEPELPGLSVSKAELEKEILAAVLSLEDSHLFNFPQVKSSLTAQILSRSYQKVLGLLDGRPSVYFGDQNFPMSESRFLEMLSFSKEGTPSANLAAVSEFVDSLASKINRPSRALSFSAQGNKILSFSPGEEGFSLDEPAAKKTLALSILKGNSQKIYLPVRAEPAKVVANDYGIKDLLGEGVSDFSGSIAGRVKNIQVAAGKLNGILVSPGDVFSFDDSVGEISAATGYDYAYIISEGRTVLGTGGGVCQVSTTVFRAALYSGLPIVERTAHAYRVHYYEQGSPLGMDATVFSPSVDLKFKNDTPGYILITSEVAGTKLYFRIYGTGDGRQTQISSPVIISSSPAPAPLYQDDQTLPKGEIKQVDFAAPGAEVYFERTVSRNGQVLDQDKFVSNYRPWQAIYLVGTKV